MHIIQKEFQGNYLKITKMLAYLLWLECHNMFLRGEASWLSCTEWIDLVSIRQGQCRPGSGRVCRSTQDREYLGKEGSCGTPGFCIGWLCEWWCSSWSCKYGQRGRMKKASAELSTQTCSHTVICASQSNFNNPFCPHNRIVDISIL